MIPKNFDPDDEALLLAGAGGRNARRDYFRNLAKNEIGLHGTPISAVERIKNEKSPEEIRLANAHYSPPQLDIEALKRRSLVSPGKNFDKCFDMPVEVIGHNISEKMVIRSFESFLWHKALLRNVQTSGLVKLTPVQKYAMPYVWDLRDVVVCSPTGSGKTAAYVLPILLYILQRGDITWPKLPNPAPCAIIVAPNRELADQIKDEIRRYAEDTKIHVVVVYGGTNVRYQVEYIRKRGCHILVGTPGRLLQLMSEGRFRLSQCKFVVLDEAHRLLDSLEDESTVRQLLQFPDLPLSGHYRNTLMFSATFPKGVQKLAEQFLYDPVSVNVGKVGGANEDVVQTILPVPECEKLHKLLEIILADLKKV